MTIDFRHPRRARVRTGAEYERVFKTGRRIALPAAALHWRAQEPLPADTLSPDAGTPDARFAHVAHVALDLSQPAPPQMTLDQPAPVATSVVGADAASGASGIISAAVTRSAARRVTTARLGLAVSRKVDPEAVGRNRIKRVWRDAFRQVRAGLPVADYVLVARPPCRDLDNAALRHVLVTLLGRAGALPLPVAARTLPTAVHRTDDSPSVSLPTPVSAEPPCP